MRELYVSTSCVRTISKSSSQAMFCGAAGVAASVPATKLLPRAQTTSNIGRTNRASTGGCRTAPKAAGAHSTRSQRISCEIFSALVSRGCLGGSPTKAASKTLHSSRTCWTFSLQPGEPIKQSLSSAFSGALEPASKPPAMMLSLSSPDDTSARSTAVFISYASQDAEMAERICAPTPDS